MIDIVPAVEADYPVLSNILSLAMAPSTVDRLLFKEYDHFADGVKFALGWLHELGTSPDCHVIKAVLRDTGEMVGYAVAIFCKADENKAAASNGGVLPSYVNEQFCSRFFATLNEKRNHHMAGKDHWNLDQLMVHPSHQRKGIGGQLLAWGLANWPIRNSPIYLSAQLTGHKLYRKYGWQDVDEIILDLSEYMPPFSGYGLHKTICMVRPAL